MEAVKGKKRERGETGGERKEKIGGGVGGAGGERKERERGGGRCSQPLSDQNDSRRSRRTEDDDTRGRILSSFFIRPHLPVGEKKWRCKTKPKGKEPMRTF